VHKYIFFSIFVLIFIFISNEIVSLEKKKFLSTRYNEVNVRKGPGKNHYVISILLKKCIPLEIISTFDSWVNTIDVEGDVGWISKSQLSEKKCGIIIKDTHLYSFPDIKSKKSAIFRKNLIIKVKKCKKKWCKVKHKDFSGWIEKQFFWGPG
tara:strand:+ start:1065 stop:1520 length:456 start_codon:yes stop_codon:yes gene_type:complete